MVAMSVMEEASAVLHTATPATDRALLAWSVGAFRVRHCLHLTQYRRSRDPGVLDSQCAGGAGGGFEYWNNTKGFDGLVRTSGYRFHVRWREVAAVLDRAVHDPELADEQERLLRQRVQLTERRDEQFRQWQRGDHADPAEDERDELGEQWAYLERRCEQAAARTWRLCQPKEQQLALFP